MKNINRMNREDLINRTLSVIKIAPKMNRYASYGNAFRVDPDVLKERIQSAKDNRKGSVKKLRANSKNAIQDMNRLIYREAHPDYAKRQDKKLEENYRKWQKIIKIRNDSRLALAYLKRATKMVKLGKEAVRHFTYRREQLIKAKQSHDYGLMEKQGDISDQIGSFITDAEYIDNGRTLVEIKKGGSVFP